MYIVIHVVTVRSVLPYSSNADMADRVVRGVEVGADGSVVVEAHRTVVLSESVVERSVSLPNVQFVTFCACDHVDYVG